MRTKVAKNLCAILFALALCFMVIGTVTFSNALAVSDSKVFVSVDTLSYETDGVEGKTYPIFDYQAVDEQGNMVTDVDVLVTAPNGDYVKIVDSRFSTDSVGVYIITYKATNGVSESIVELYVNVIAQEKYSAPKYVINDKVVSSATTGEKVFLPEGVLSGGVGNVSVTLDVLYDGEYDCGKVVIQDNGYGAYFVPEVAGKYTVKYSMIDIVSTTQTHAEKDITVSDSTLPLLHIPSVSMSGIVGEKLTFERTEAVVYVEGEKIYVPVKTYFDGKDVTETMSIVPDKAGTYKLRYEAVNVLNGGAQDVAVYETDVQIIDKAQSATQRLPYITNYLYLDGFTGAWIVEPENSSDKVSGVEYDVYTLTADGSKDSAFMQFQSAIPTRYASINLGFNAPNANLDSVYIYFTDSADGEKVIEVRLAENDAQKTEVYVNGIYAKTLEKSISDTSKFITDLTFNFEIDSVSGVLREVTSKTDVITLTAYQNGEKFDLFGSGKVYISIKLEGVTGKTDVKLYDIANQGISSQSTDKGKPLFVTPKNFTGVYNVELNKKFTLEKVEVFDLFDENVTINVKIEAPDKTVIYQGALIENYSFTPNMYGQYSIYYIANDTSKASRELKCVVNIVDRVAPSVSVVGVPERVKVGETVTFNKAEIVDNNQKDVVSWIYVIHGNFQRTTLDQERKFTFEKAGTYIVKYGAEDKDGNFTVVTYTVICE